MIVTRRILVPFPRAWRDEWHSDSQLKWIAVPVCERMSRWYQILTGIKPLSVEQEKDLEVRILTGRLKDPRESPGFDPRERPKVLAQGPMKAMHDVYGLYEYNLPGHRRRRK